jgi:hypothetical protein
MPESLPRLVRATRGTTLRCRGWQQEAALRMLMNNLDPDVAEALTSPGLGNGTHNPGGCTVSKKCFLPSHFVAWADALVATLPNLRVYRSTAVTAVG